MSEFLFAVVSMHGSLGERDQVHPHEANFEQGPDAAFVPVDEHLGPTAEPDGRGKPVNIQTHATSFSEAERYSRHVAHQVISAKFARQHVAVA